MWRATAWEFSMAIHQYLLHYMGLFYIKQKKDNGWLSSLYLISPLDVFGFYMKLYYWIRSPSGTMMDPARPQSCGDTLQTGFSQVVLILLAISSTHPYFIKDSHVNMKHPIQDHHFHSSQPPRHSLHHPSSFSTFSTTSLTPPNFHCSHV
jgi:hypothetical protein